MSHELEHRLYQFNDGGELQLNFHPGQKQVWDSKARFIFALAGTRGGKTSFAPWWLYREVMRTYTRGGKNDYLTVSPTVELFNNAFLPAMIEVFCEVLEIGYYWAAARTLELKCLDPQDERYGQFYEGPNGRSSGLMWARIILRSAQSEGALESMTAKAAVLDECGQDAFALEDWEAVQRRVSIGQARILGTTTPYNFGWLYSTVYQHWLDGDPDFDIINFPSYYNPSFDMAEYERARRSMPEWRFKLFYDGKFQAPSGLIYRDFDESTMVIRDEFEIPKEWEHVVGVDFGGANTATVWLAFNPNDGRWYLYRETLMGHMPTVEHAELAKSHAAGIDRLTAIGGAKSEGQYRDDWWYAGFYIDECPVSNVEVGIARAITLIKSDRLRIFHSCQGILAEMKQYRRKLDSNNEPTEQIIDKNKFHRLDALRYAASWIEDVPPGVEALSYESLVAKFEKEGRYEYA